MKKNTMVCSLHFKKSDYSYTPLRKCLIKGKVPSVFSLEDIKAERENNTHDSTPAGGLNENRLQLKSFHLE